MTSDHIIFVGIDISSGRKPVTVATLGDVLNITALEQWTVVDSVACLRGYESALLVINSPAQKAENKISADFKRKIAQAGFSPVLKNSSHCWLETDAQQCFLELCENELLPRRTLEGRIQRALILYDQGLQIPDPMDFFEEITRHKLMQGHLPTENLYSIRALDALMAAYVAWISQNRRDQIKTFEKNSVLLVEEEN